MVFLKASRFAVKNPVLRQCIKYFWVMQSEHHTAVHHKLLPVSNIDFVLNFSAPIKYVIADKIEIVPKKFHFIGLRNQPYTICQAGRLNIFGISFFPAGLYPFLKTPLSEFTNKVIELEAPAGKLTTAIEEKLSIAASVAEKLEAIENELTELIDIKLLPTQQVKHIYSAFNANLDCLNVDRFCREYGISQRKLERIFNKYIGISPKLYYRINRFQRVVNQMFNNNNPAKLVSLAYEHEFWDQNHFIKDFKAFTGSSPSHFLKERKSIKEILKTD